MSTETNFTKGEWEVSTDGLSVGAGGFKVARAFSGSATPYVMQTISNAHLIAAAPEMYETLIKISEAINSGLYEIELADAITEFGGDIENILAKARGELV